MEAQEASGEDSAVRELVDGRARLRRVCRRMPSETTITVGSGIVALTAGEAWVMTLSLNGSGRALLERFHELPVRRTVTETVAGTQWTVSVQTVSFKSMTHGRMREH